MTSITSVPSITSFSFDARNASDASDADSKLASIDGVGGSLTYVYDGQHSIHARDHQAQDELELGDQDVDGGGGGEAGHQRVGQIPDHEAHLQQAHAQLEGGGGEVRKV